MQTTREENKMGIMPVNQLLLSMSLPMMISMLVQALYNVVDSIFVSWISENALTAVSLAFPVQGLMIAVGSGIGVGVNAVLSRSLGEKNQKKVLSSASQGLLLSAAAYILFLVLAFVIVKPFFFIQTNDTEIIQFGTQYLTICCAFSFGMFGQFIFERLLQSTGQTIYTMFTQGLGAIINIILDPILIFGLFGLPALGVAGAAIATVIGQIIAGCLAIYFNLKRNHEVDLRQCQFSVQLPMAKQILVIAVPSILMQSIGSVMTLGLNKILISFSATAVAVFGVYFKLQSFVFMPVFGLNNGMVPIVSYNYGAGRKDRMTKTIRYSIYYAVGIMLVGFCVVQLVPEQLLLLFNASDRMLEMGVPALRIISLSFIFAGYCVIISSSFQALGYSVYSLIISLCRQLVILLPVAWLFAQSGVLSMVWWSFPIAELCCVFICTFLFLRVYRTSLNQIQVS